MTIFTYAALPHNPAFALGLYTTPAPVARPRPYTTLDQCWAAGFAAGQEDGTEALPPAHYDDDQTFAWHQGHTSAVWGSDESDPSSPADWDDDDLAREQAMIEDARACGLID